MRKVIGSVLLAITFTACGSDGEFMLFPRGKTGAHGAKGEKGDEGPQGPVGPQGPQGSVGPTGAQGSEGPSGPQGGEGPMGPQGPESNSDLLWCDCDWYGECEEKIGTIQDIIDNYRRGQDHFGECEMQNPSQNGVDYEQEK